MDHDELAQTIEQVLGAETPEARQEAFGAITDLDATETEWAALATGILNDAEASAEDLDTAAALADALEHLRTERDRRNGVLAAEADRRAELAARVSGDSPEPEPEADETAETDEVDATLAADTTEAAAEGDTPEAPAAVVEAAPEPAPKAPRPSLSALRKRVPADAQPREESGRISVRAGMDVPGFASGAELRDLRDIATAVIKRREALGRVTPGASVVTEQVPVVTFNYLDELKQVGEDRMLNGLLLREAGQPDALTASGGFCAPAQVVYDFVKVNKPTDLVQDFLPVVGAPRGSIEYPTSPDIRDAFTDNVTRAYSAADDVASTHKVTAVIDCPSFNTCTTGAQYVILQFGNFGTRAYPEWVEHWVGLSMDAHAHKVSQKLITQMMTLSSAAVPTGPNGGATASLISNLAMAAADMRHDLRMGRQATLEAVLPSWTTNLIRSDLARARKGQPSETLQVTDAQVNAWLSNLGLNVHFVEDWQDTSGSASTGASAWPLGLDFLLYPPGTFVKLDMGTLDLGVVRDSTLNATNDYNIFVESFESVCKPGIESRLYSISICANGSFARDEYLDCTGVHVAGS